MPGPSAPYIGSSKCSEGWPCSLKTNLRCLFLFVCASSQTNSSQLRVALLKSASKMPFGYACDRCRQKHQSCDHQFPCQRCLKANCGEVCHYTPKRARTRKAPSVSKSLRKNDILLATSSSLSPTSASSAFAGNTEGSIDARSVPFFDGNFSGMLPVNDALFEYAVPSNSPMHPASYLKSGLGKMPVPVYNGQAPYLLQANQQQIYMQQQQMRLNHQEGGQITNAAPYKNGTDAQRHAGKYPVPVGPHDQYGMGDASQYSYIQPNVYMHQYLGHQMLSASGQIVPNSTPVPPVSSSLSHSVPERVRRRTTTATTSSFHR